MGMIELPPIKETTEYYEALEDAIKKFYREEIYVPLLREFTRKSLTVKNARVPDLSSALQTGQVTFYRGVFSGRFNSEISKELRKLGARFSRRDSTYRIPQADLPLSIRMAISSSDAKFREKIEKVDQTLGQVVTDELLGKGISKKLKTDHFFDRALWKVDQAFHKNVKNITIAPELTPERRKRIAAEWGENMQLWIKDFNEKEITELRQNMMRTIFSGDRYGSAIKTIQDSYGVTERKAKFLARQETSLLMAKFKQTRYEDAGVRYYRWGCVAGSKNHPVRPWHKALEGKVFRWDEPPVTTKPGEAQRKCNPSQDYNCRCFARPLVNYRGPTGVKAPR